MRARLQRRWDARMAARPSPLHDMTPEQARAYARPSAFLMLRALAFVVLAFGLARIAAQYAGVPAYLGVPLVLAAQAAWWALKRKCRS